MILLPLVGIGKLSVDNVLVLALTAVPATKMVELVERLRCLAGSLAQCFHFQVGDEQK